MDAEAAVREGRARIDEIDAQLIELVRERAEVSRSIQQARIAGGGRRIEHGRELAILDRYSQGLGQQGGALAMAVLEFCRGRVSS